MKQRIHPWHWVGVVSAAIVLWSAGPLLLRSAQSAIWEQDIRAFEAMDHKSPPPPHQIVFYGASMIVRWDLQKSFPDLAAINRGFGGSEMIDALHYADRVVIPYKPRIVVIYEGDNDTAMGAAPEDVAKNFALLADKIHAALPDTKIIDISVKPSFARWGLMEKQRVTNALLQAYCAKHNYLAFLDVSHLTLGADGKPRRELYDPDGLHFSDEGYKLWNAAIRPLLQ